MHANFLIWGAGHSRPYQRKSTLCAEYWSRVPLLETAKRHNQVVKWEQRPYLEKKSKKNGTLVAQLAGVFNIICFILTKPSSPERVRVAIESYKRWIPAFSYLQSFPSAMLFTKISSALVLFTLSATACTNASDCDIGCSSDTGFTVTTCRQ